MQMGASPLLNVFVLRFLLEQLQKGDFGLQVEFQPGLVELVFQLLLDLRLALRSDTRPVD